MMYFSHSKTHFIAKRQLCCTLTYLCLRKIKLRMGGLELAQGLQKGSSPMDETNGADIPPS
jgi:hypothetical protein